MPVTKVIISDDLLSARLTCSNLRAGYVHEFHADALRSADNQPLLHPDAYYTLNRLPDK